MIRQPVESPIVAASVRVYQALLVTYPAGFQEEYGSQMVQVFRDCCLGAVRQGGMYRMVRFWTKTLLDLVQSVISEHAHKEIEMKNEMKPGDIRLAGLALMWGAGTFTLGVLVILLGGDKLWGVSAALTNVLGMSLFVVGLLGLRKRYGEKAGPIGKSLLWLGAVLGPSLTFIGLFGVSYSFPPLGILFTAGPAVLLTCLASFGVVTLFKRPLPRWNWLPILAGISYPILVFAYIFISLNTGDWSGGSGPTMPQVLVAIPLIIQGLALAALGYLLKSDAPDQVPAIV